MRNYMGVNERAEVSGGEPRGGKLLPKMTASHVCGAFDRLTFDHLALRFGS